MTDPAKGDLLTVDANLHLSRLPAGTDGDALICDSSTPTGLRWGTGGGGGGGGMGSRAFAVVNESTVVSDGDVATMTAAISRQVIEHLAPAWDALGAGVTFYPGGVGTAPAGAIIVHVADDTDIPGDAGYHTLAGGAPVAFVFAKTITDGGGGVLTGPGGGLGSYCVARALSHEICETFVDPKLQELADDFAAHAWLIEVGDTVNNFAYDIDGVDVSDFGLPSWWDPNGTTPFSHADNTPGPFSLVAGSYCFRYNTSGGSTIMGSHTGEILVANPELLRDDDYERLMLNTSVARALRARGLPPPRVRPVEGRSRDWTPDS